MRRLLLWLALGRHDYRLMLSMFSQYPGLRGAHMVDVIVRADARERRLQADWLKRLCAICIPRV